MDAIDVINKIGNTKKPREREGTVRVKHFTHLLVQPKGSTRLVPCDYESGATVDVGDRVTFLWVQSSKKYIVSAIFNTPKTIRPTTGTVLTTNTDHVLHDNIGGEILSVRRKATPVDDDLLFANDSEDGYRPKSIRVGDLPGGGGSIAVDDGTDTVDPASQLSFDPAFFDVSDAGGGQALVTFVGTGGGGGGGVPPTLLLNYTEAATVFSNTVLAATTWTDVGVNHTFTVTDAAALIDITAVMAMQVGGSGSAIDIGMRLVIDSAGTPIYHELGGGWAAASAWYEPAGGSIKVSGLSVGAHTIKLQVYATSAAHLFLDPSGLPDTEGMTLQVTQLSGGGSALSPTLIYDYTLPSDGTFDTNTTDDRGNTGISQLYTDLELRISGIGAAGVTAGVEVFFNGDTNTAHYDGGRSLVNGGSSGGDLNEIGFVGTQGVGSYGTIIADVPGYTLTATHRTLIARSAVDGGGTSPNFWQYALQHNQAGALTQFQAHCRSAGNFAAGSRLRIYGIP